MKKLVVEDENEGLVSLIGERVFIMTSGYFYTGTLVGVNDTDIKLENPAIVYETGSWSNPKYADEQKLGTKYHYVRTNAIESYGLGK